MVFNFSMFEFNFSPIPLIYRNVAKMVTNCKQSSIGWEFDITDLLFLIIYCCTVYRFEFLVYNFQTSILTAYNDKILLADTNASSSDWICEFLYFRLWNLPRLRAFFKKQFKPLKLLFGFDVPNSNWSIIWTCYIRRSFIKS